MEFSFEGCVIPELLGLGAKAGFRREDCKSPVHTRAGGLNAWLDVYFLGAATSSRSSNDDCPDAAHLGVVHKLCYAQHF